VRDRQPHDLTGTGFQRYHGPVELSLDPLTVAVLLLAGLLAGVVSAIAGGASFVTFPVLIALGLPPVAANATNYLALFPANVFALPAYRGEIRRARSGLMVRGAIAALGGWLGAKLLFWFDERVFAALVPWLLLAATAAFALGPRASVLVLRWTRRPYARTSLLSLAVEAVLALYCGYFGAGVGIMMLAAFVALGQDDLQEANGLKNLLLTVASTAALAVYGVSGAVAWPAALLMMGSAAAGGYAGARLARVLPVALFRGIVTGVGAVLTAWFFWATNA
jgi:uncharacterized membrane protein YfcA